MARNTALILAGAVAKGAFEAGVLDVLSKHAREIPISRIVAASSGALNGAAYATGIRAGAEEQVATRLVDLWLHDANWHSVFKPSLMDILRADGLSSAASLLSMMQGAVNNLGFGSPQPIELRLILTALLGEVGDIGGDRATTFEHVAEFQNDQFDTDQGRDSIFRTALGSASFPVLFAPMNVPGVGLSVDGGVVNNTPIKHAIEGGADRIIVVTPEPREVSAPGPLGGLNLISQLAEILINERLYRDLHDAESVNDVLRRIDALTQNGISPDAIQKVKDILGWVPLEIVQIRPANALDGSPFSGFSNAAQMKTYVDAGREAASAALDVLNR